MRRTEGFTLIELLVLVFVLASLGLLLVPACNRGAQKKAASSNAKKTSAANVRKAGALDGPKMRALCASNLHAIGMALKMYYNENEMQYPYVSDMDGVNSQTTSTGTARTTDPNSNTTIENGVQSITTIARNNSANLYLLVRCEQPVQEFICPSDPNAKVEPNPTYTDSSGKKIFAWDFSPSPKTGNTREHYVSYSYQAMCYVPSRAGGLYSPGILGQTDPQVAVAADMTPANTYNDAPGTAARDLVVDWTKTVSKQADRNAMSQNHSGGAFINYLTLDGAVHGSDRPDVGINHDAIYTTAAGPEDGPKDDNNYISRGAHQSVKIADHTSINDSFLIGPTK